MTLPATSQATAPVSTTNRTERLFDVLLTMYGRHWLDMWADVPIEEVKRTWDTALRAFSGETIKLALDYLTKNNKFPPTAPEFVQICRQFRQEPAHRLMLPDKRPAEPIPPHLKAKIASFLRHVRNPKPAPGNGGLTEGEQHGEGQSSGEKAGPAQGR